MKVLRKEVGVIRVQTSSNVNIDFEFDYGYKKYFAFLPFVDDDPRRFDFNKLSDLKKSSDVLKSLVELKEFDDSIKIIFSGDRSGEHFSITVNEDTMVKLAKKWAKK